MTADGPGFGLGGAGDDTHQNFGAVVTYLEPLLALWL